MDFLQIQYINIDLEWAENIFTWSTEPMKKHQPASLPPTFLCAPLPRDRFFLSISFAASATHTPARLGTDMLPRCVNYYWVIIL